MTLYNGLRGYADANPRQSQLCQTYLTFPSGYGLAERVGVAGVCRGEYLPLLTSDADPHVLCDYARA